MGCSLGAARQAKKEAEEENLVEKPGDTKNEENVLFERTAATGENAQTPLLEEENKAEQEETLLPDADIVSDKDIDIVVENDLSSSSPEHELQQTVINAPILDITLLKECEQNSPEQIAAANTENLEKQEVLQSQDEDFVIVENDKLHQQMETPAAAVSPTASQAISEEIHKESNSSESKKDLMNPVVQPLFDELDSKIAAAEEIVEAVMTDTEVSRNVFEPIAHQDSSLSDNIMEVQQLQESSSIEFSKDISTETATLRQSEEIVTDSVVNVLESLNIETEAIVQHKEPEKLIDDLEIVGKQEVIMTGSTLKEPNSESDSCAAVKADQVAAMLSEQAEVKLFDLEVTDACKELLPFEDVQPAVSEIQNATDSLFEKLENTSTQMAFVPGELSHTVALGTEIVPQVEDIDQQVDLPEPVQEIIEENVAVEHLASILTDTEPTENFQTSDQLEGTQQPSGVELIEKVITEQALSGIIAETDRFFPLPPPPPPPPPETDLSSNKQEQEAVTQVQNQTESAELVEDDDLLQAFINDHKNEVSDTKCHKDMMTETYPNDIPLPLAETNTTSEIISEKHVVKAAAESENNEQSKVNNEDLYANEEHKEIVEDTNTIFMSQAENNQVENAEKLHPEECISVSRPDDPLEESVSDKQAEHNLISLDQDSVNALSTAQEKRIAETEDKLINASPTDQTKNESVFQESDHCSEQATTLETFEADLQVEQHGEKISRVLQTTEDQPDQLVQAENVAESLEPLQQQQVNCIYLAEESDNQALKESTVNVEKLEITSENDISSKQIAMGISAVNHEQTEKDYSKETENQRETYLEENAELANTVSAVNGSEQTEIISNAKSLADFAEPTAVEELSQQKIPSADENISVASESNTQEVQSVPNGESQVQTEETGHDPAEQGAKSEDRFYNSDAFKGTGIDANDSEQQETALKTQSQFDEHSEMGKSDHSPDRQLLEKINFNTDGEPVKDLDTKTMNEEMSEMTVKDKEERDTKMQAEGYAEFQMKNAAAKKIQAGIRGHLTRKKVKTLKEKAFGKHLVKAAHAATKIQAIVRGHRARQQVKLMKVKAKAMETSVSINLDDPKLNEAATKIQAYVRGRRARKEVKILKVQAKHSEHGKTYKKQADEIILENNVDLKAATTTEGIQNDITDPELNKAAEKIQASFRGHRVRQEMKDLKAQPSPLPNVEDVSSIDLSDPQLSEAAVKIQAGFRGHQVRQHLNASKEPTVSTPLTAEESVDSLADDAALKIQAGFRGYKTRKELRAEQERKNVLKPDNTTDIDLTNPEVSAAAVKIQANFRGYKTREELKQQDKKSNEEKPSETAYFDLSDSEINAAALKIQAGFRGYKVREELKQHKKNDDTVDIDLSDPEVSAAALKIQAGFRGYKTREKLKQKSHLNNCGNSGTDIDLTDPDVAAAAEKIQAHFRGFISRQNLKSQTVTERSRTTTEKLSSGFDDVDLNDPELAAAATKIQASYRGHRIRQDLLSKTMEHAKDTEKSSPKDVDVNDPELAAAAVKIQASYRGHRTRQDLHNSQTPVQSDMPPRQPSDFIDGLTGVDVNDPELAAAAVKIQASYRGHRTRQDLHNSQTPLAQSNMSPKPSLDSRDDLTGVDVNDPELSAAAVKIQASYRGHRTRQDLHNSQTLHKDNEPSTEITTQQPESDEAVDFDLTDPDVNSAAIKIQAGFRGHMTRKELKADGKVASEEQPGKQQIADDEAKKAAIKIQAGFRGYKVRKELNDNCRKEEAGGDAPIHDGNHLLDVPSIADRPEKATEEGGSNQPSYGLETSERNSASVDYQDPEVENAAVKIQAGFKGYQTRKQLKERKDKSHGIVDDEI